jgi:hypothetical protein
MATWGQTTASKEEEDGPGGVDLAAFGGGGITLQLDEVKRNSVLL